jgi:hypothetical protein
VVSVEEVQGLVEAKRTSYLKQSNEALDKVEHYY